MSYIGRAPGFGIRNRYYYTATAAQTTPDELKAARPSALQDLKTD